MGLVFSPKERDLDVAIKRWKFGFLLTLFIIPYSKLFAQKKYNCLDWKYNVSVNTFLVQKMHEQYDERGKELACAVTSIGLTKQYMKNVGARITALFGNFPQKTALHAIAAGTLHREGYKIEKIIFERFPNHHVRANIYIPNGKGRFPAA